MNDISDKQSVIASALQEVAASLENVAVATRKVRFAKTILVKARNRYKDAKKALLVARLGQDGAAKLCARMEQARAVNPKAGGIAHPTSTQTSTPLTLVSTTPVAQTPLTATPQLPATSASGVTVFPQCAKCGQVISVRGLCGCPGVRHREVRRIEPGPKMTIKHPPLPPVELGREGAS